MFVTYLHLARRGIVVDVVPSDAAGQIDVGALRKRIDDRVRLIALTHAPTNGGLVQPAEAVGETAAVEVPPAVARQRTINILLWTLFFFIAIWFLGFSYAVPIVILLYLKFAGKEKWPMTLAVTFFTWLFFYALFERALSVPFPDGLLFTLFKGQ